MEKKQKIDIFWFRRDLRLEDNCGLFHALNTPNPILPIFIFDPEILQQFEDKYDRRVDYFHQALNSLHQQLLLQQSGIRFFYQNVLECFQDLVAQYDIEAVYCNTDYEPDALERDARVRDFLKSHQIRFKNYKDQVVFEANEILKADQTPYTIFTPYSKKWLEKIQPFHYQPHPSGAFLSNLHLWNAPPIPTLTDLGFKTTDIVFQKPDLNVIHIENFETVREYPILDASSHLGIALRFGTVSIRACVALGLKSNATWLKALIWRGFFMQILFHFPKVVHHSFKSKYDSIIWRNDENDFEKWCNGQTGYPLVDAGMRQLNKTGLMHNRVRMVVASFLSKHLLIDWRWGEAYFAQKLLDYDLAANNGNWQWAAGTGCDAAPYFRVFNPEAQMKKFDAEQLYIQKWIPEWNSDIYPQPMVEHAFARARALDAYKKALKSDF
ncbi:deoxyribodipyrimidine photo-lyase [Flavobacterium sp. NKUCC04_CG]|uniref:cryptochrome/photolyase family protein n=1 Tax=Flavobacterium sp. NKUCC04_CG TaxID=2842121 RepID=UPI001C5BABFC|nr:deoxyribodipyrimidine photo-lyase [Flavobacterium sp. NKUCC04_CG]MBW3518441.1 DNA photolyase family protein [Flavobacterium sp. NKUCC04_CG]